MWREETESRTTWKRSHERNEKRKQNRTASTTLSTGAQVIVSPKLPRCKTHGRTAGPHPFDTPFHVCFLFSIQAQLYESLGSLIGEKWKRFPATQVIEKTCKKLYSSSFYFPRRGIFTVVNINHCCSVNEDKLSDFLSRAQCSAGSGILFQSSTFLPKLIRVNHVIVLELTPEKIKYNLLYPGMFHFMLRDFQILDIRIRAAGKYL